jgi:2-oxoglutarate/2-oxoacid ferredoxin oxidoreductase subunit beta
MVDVKEFGDIETAWCPGCGNFALLRAIKDALAQSDLYPRDVLFVSGIGQAAKTPHYLKANVFNGLHGRGLPAATGAKIANPALKVIYDSGDGCTYGEGGNHFLAAMRRNIGLTMIVHDNQVYGLTKGQASPTSDEGFVTGAQPHGALSAPENPVLLAVSMRVPFVARGYVGEREHLTALLREALSVHGLALVDVLQPCVSFNKINTYEWYKKRCYLLGSDHDPGAWLSAMARASEWGDRIPLGVLYRNETREPFEKRCAPSSATGLVGHAPETEALQGLMRQFG